VQRAVVDIGINSLVFVERRFDAGRGDQKTHVHEVGCLPECYKFPFERTKGVHGGLKGSEVELVDVWV
jgi:hypothetical protein